MNRKEHNIKQNKRYRETHPAPIKKCMVCKKKFKSIKKALMCSDECKYKHKIEEGRKYYYNNTETSNLAAKLWHQKHHKPKISVCVICKKTFIKGKGQKNVCSKECYNIQDGRRHKKFKRLNPKYNYHYARSPQGKLALKKGTILRRDRKKMVGEKEHVRDNLDLEKINNKFHNKCFNCGMTQQQHRKRFGQDLRFDHFRPLRKGFALTEYNCVLLCRPCNGKKLAKAPEDFFTKKQLTILKNKYGVS